MAKKLTFADLLTAAKSPDAKLRQQALEAFNTWQKLAPKLQPQQRLTRSECDVLKQVFAQHA